MPRNSSGVYSLPPGNPVVPDTLIETTWANPTMSDIAAALTGSLPRDGSAPMTGPLILNGNASLALAAVPLQQMNATMNSSDNYMPAGTIQCFAFINVPSGWLICDGAAISRTTYANLFSYIGTTFGEGNGTTTFNVPDLRGQFIRGLDQGRSVDPGRGMGTTQSAANQAHSHVITLGDPGHTHGVTDPGHIHGVTDPGHTHGGQLFNAGAVVSATNAAQFFALGAIPAALTGIGIQSGQTNISMLQGLTGITATANTQGTESRPTNVALVYCIKAFGALQQDALGTMAFQNAANVWINGGTGAFATLQCVNAPVAPTDVVRLQDIGGTITQIFSSDTAVLTIDATVPNQVTLRPQTNVPSGMVKLNSAGYIPPSLLTLNGLDYQGPWDASTGLLPTGTFTDGMFFEITTAGTLTLNTTAGVTAKACSVGDNIIWSVSNPTWSITGWYYSPASVAATINATAVVFTPGGTVAATNVQAAITEVAAEKLALTGGVMTGQLTVPTTIQSNQQLGRSATAFNNFTLDASSANGTMELYRGNVGTLIQDIMLVHSNGVVTFPQNAQTWQSPVRVIDVLYTNDTLQPIDISATVSSNAGTSAAFLQISGVRTAVAYAIYNSFSGFLYGRVPVGATYGILQIAGASVISDWKELR